MFGLTPVLNKWFMNATLCFKAFFCCISVSIPPNHPDNLKCLRLRKKEYFTGMLKYVCTVHFFSAVFHLEASQSVKSSSSFEGLL